MPRRAPCRWKRASRQTNAVRDEVVRRYYRQDLAERLQRAFAPEGGRGNYVRGNFAVRRDRSPRRFAPAPAVRPVASPERRAGRPDRHRSRAYQAATRNCGKPDHARPAPAISRRSAVLQSLINHPWLLHDHLEEVAALELAHPEAHKLRAGIMAAFAQDHHHSPEPAEQAEKMRADLAVRGLTPILQRVERAITTAAVFGANTGAAREDVLATWRQLVALHQKTHALLREMKDAEQALAGDSSEANLVWLKDIQGRMAEADGTEALIEGFGELSGRFQKSV